MKPWEEMWRQGTAEDVDWMEPEMQVLGVGGNTPECVADCSTYPREDGECEARAALIAKAPEMARMLLAREWECVPRQVDPNIDPLLLDGVDFVCPEDTCTAMKGEAHDPGCHWLALMKAIGAR